MLVFDVCSLLALQERILQGKIVHKDVFHWLEYIVGSSEKEGGNGPRATSVECGIF